jgi:hypothetical protein
MACPTLRRVRTSNNAKHLRRMSGLLAGQANFEWASAKIEEAHACLFDALNAHRSISLDQAFPIFMHAWKSRDDRRLSGYLAGLANDKDKLRDNLAEYLAPARLIARGKSATMTGRLSARTLALLKTVQFRIARGQDPAQLPDLASEWSDAIARICNQEMREKNRMLWAISIADSHERAFPPAMLALASEEMNRLESLAPEGSFSENFSADLAPGGVAGNGDTIAVLFGFNFARGDDFDYSDKGLDSLTKANPNARTRMLNAFEIPFFKKNHLFFEGPWIKEAKRPEPRWVLAERTLWRMLAVLPWRTIGNAAAWPSWPLAHSPFYATAISIGMKTGSPACERPLPGSENRLF